MSTESPAPKQQIAEHLPWLAAVVSGSDQHIDYFNGSFLRTFREPLVPAELMGPGPHTESRSLRARIARVLETGRPERVHRCEIPREYRGDGSGRGRRYLDFWLEPIKPDGEPTSAVIVYGVDVTHRVHAAMTLRRTLDLQRQLLASLASRFWGADPLGEEVWEMDGRSRLLPRDPRHVPPVSPDGRAASPSESIPFRDTAEWLEALQGRTPFLKTHSVVREDGPHAFITHALPVLADDGEVIQWIGVDIDVTEHVRASDAHAAAGATPALESRVRTMRDFSHDVRNALHAADGYAQLLEVQLHDPLSEEQLEYLGRMREIFHNALELLGDVLNVERALSGELEIESKPTDVDKLVADCADGHRAEAELKRLMLQVDRMPGPLWTRTDPVRVRQILDNLVSNALKYTRSGGVTIRIRTEAALREVDRRRWIAIGVSDTGPGVPPTSREAIFREFVRVAGQNETGHGVGLFISRRLARLLGGEITMESEAGSGSTFTLWLPLVWDDGPASSKGRSQ